MWRHTDWIPLLLHATGLAHWKHWPREVTQWVGDEKCISTIPTMRRKTIPGLQMGSNLTVIRPHLQDVHLLLWDIESAFSYHPSVLLSTWCTRSECSAYSAMCVSTSICWLSSCILCMYVLCCACSLRILLAVCNVNKLCPGNEWMELTQTHPTISCISLVYKFCSCCKMHLLQIVLVQNRHWQVVYIRTYLHAILGITTTILLLLYLDICSSRLVYCRCGARVCSWETLCSWIHFQWSSFQRILFQRDSWRDWKAWTCGGYYGCPYASKLSHYILFVLGG